MNAKFKMGDKVLFIDKPPYTADNFRGIYKITNVRFSDILEVYIYKVEDVDNYANWTEVLEKYIELYNAAPKFKIGDKVIINSGYGVAGVVYTVTEIKPATDFINNKYNYVVESGELKFIPMEKSLELVKEERTMERDTFVVPVRRRHGSYNAEFYDIERAADTLEQCKARVTRIAKEDSTWHVHNPVIRFETVKLYNIIEFTIWRDNVKYDSSTNYEEALKKADKLALELTGKLITVKNYSGAEVDRIMYSKQHTKLDP